MTPRAPLPDVDPRQRLKAIGLMVLATVCFAALDATGKYLITVKAMPVAEVTWVRFAGHVVFSAVVLWPFAFRPSLRSAKPVIQILRACLMVVTTGFNFLALRYLQLDQTITIFFLTPLLVALLAGPLLHEWVGWHRMVAIIAGFFGVLIVMHPGFGTLHWAMLLALVATLGYALYNLATRYLAAHDPAAVTQSYTPLAGALIMMPFALSAWQTPQDAATWLLLAALGFWGGLGLIWMSFAGYLVFGNVPTLWTLSGATVVILAGLYLFARERKTLGPRRVGPAADIASQ